MASAGHDQAVCTMFISYFVGIKPQTPANCRRCSCWNTDSNQMMYNSRCCNLENNISVGEIRQRSKGLRITRDDLWKETAHCCAKMRIRVRILCARGLRGSGRDGQNVQLLTATDVEYTRSMLRTKPLSMIAHWFEEHEKLP